MERPLKRQRLSLPPSDEDEPSGIDIHEARAQNDLRLKSIFEGIFAKYGQDFTDVGDEIDLQTGRIVVNNGHIHGMNGEHDTGVIGNLLSGPDSVPAHQEAETEGPMDGGATQETNDHTPDEGEAGKRPGRKTVSILSQILPLPNESRGTTEDEEGAADAASEAEDDRSSVDSLLGTALRVESDSGLGSGPAEADEAFAEKAIPRTQEANQSQTQRMEELDEPVDPIWRVPEINAKFTTPTLSRPRPGPVVRATVRSQSPPGSGSLWALPWKSRRNTDVTKQKKRKDTSPKNRKKHQSSPVVCDWSFAEASDGNESDDPLQEDYEPSRAAKSTLYIREKRKNSFTASHTKNTCSYCKQTFSSDDYVSHLRAVLSDPPDGQHDLPDLKTQLDKIADDRTVGLAPTESNDGSVHTPTSGLETRGKETNQDSTPTGNKRARSIIGPAEARLIIQMRHVQGKKWKEILNHLPQKTLVQLTQWNHFHWNDRKTTPPQLSRPWSKPELEKLESLKSQPDLTWQGIRAELPGRSHAEVEFKLLRLWAGDDD